MTVLEPARARPPGGTRQWLIDAALALVLTVVQLGARYASESWHGHAQVGASWDVYLLLAVASLVLIARRRFPVAVLAVSLAATLAAGSLGGGGMIWVGLIAAFVNAELAGDRVAAAASLVIGYLATVWPPWRIGTHGHTSVALALGLATWLLILLAVTELIRIRGQRTAALRRSREEEFRRRASEDRMRIARDLHDVLAHNISVINVQANTALHLMDRQPDRAREALTAIHGVSKQALEELRAVLGVLRDGDTVAGDAPRAPSPGLAQLPDLLSAVRSAGLDAELAVEGESRPLRADADIAAYRIVQESLTNVRRHSRAATASVVVSYDGSGVALEIVNDGDPVPLATGAVPAASTSQAAASGAGRASQSKLSAVQPSQAMAGNGIRGMAERVRELGGRFEAGPRADGGFLVAAWLPAAGCPTPGCPPPGCREHGP
jgi:signal transduction histidine kinase